MKLCAIPIIVSCFCLPTISAEDGSEKEAGKGKFLIRKGNALYLGGTPFRCVGVNKHELLDYYLADDFGRQRAAARASLAQLSDLGIKVIRARGSAFWPAQIEKTYPADAAGREAFWTRYDAMLADCDEFGIKVIITIAWHTCGWADLGHESLRSLVTDPYSDSRRILNDWTRDLVGRYRDRETVLFWELTNEANLTADLKAHFGKKGAVETHDLSLPHKHLFSDPVVRDERNNYTSDELAAFVREWAIMIKYIDSNHLVGTGFSEPRPSAWHLWMNSVNRAETMDWTVDTEEETGRYLKVISPDPVDLISLHHYVENGFGTLVACKKAADEIGKPVYIGECGPGGELFQANPYGDETALRMMRLFMDTVAGLDVPLAVWWTWDERSEPYHEPMLDPARHAEALEMLVEYNKQFSGAKERASRELSREEEERIRELSAQCEKLAGEAKEKR